jgi:PAS domain S-box-containing protein
MRLCDIFANSIRVKAINMNRYNMMNMPGEVNLYQKMIEEIEDYAIIMLDKNGIIQDWNKGAEKIKLYAESEIVGKHFSVFYFPEDIENDLPKKLLNEAEYTGRAGHEGWRKRKDGTRFWGSITITAIHNKDQDVIGFCKVTRDLTDKKIADDNLRMSEERYHKMVSEVQDYAIILLDVDGVIENWNVGAKKIKGYTAEEIIGKKFEIFYPEKDRRDGLPARLLSIARETGRAAHEGWRIRKDRSEFWGSITITALHNKKGDIIGFSKVTRDLTEKKLAENKLAAYTAELEKQNKELEQFAYVASHDLQEPLRKIQTFSGLIRENLSDRGLVERYFDKLEKSSKRMSGLIHSLLAYGKVSNDKSMTGGIDLNEILSQVKEDFELLIDEKNAEITSGNLPVVNGNRTHLGQLFSNLIGNSLKFSKLVPHIRISSEIVKKSEIEDAPSLNDAEYYLIRFQDNGIGFEDQYKDQIFSLFQRLHGKQEYAGTGIGLTLCKKIVENHNGFINTHSILGKGTTFNVYLPV